MTEEPQNQVDLIVRCDCGSAHFCSVRYWREDESWPEGYFEIAMVDRWDRGFLDRVRGAWRVLAHGFCERNDLILDEEKAARLVDALTPIARA